MVDLLGGQRGEQQAVAPGAGHREVEPAVIVFEAVAGEVEQREVVAAPVPVEVPDGLADPVMRLVDQRGDLEPRDARVLQDRGERLRVVCRRGQLAQPGVVVLVGGDQQRQPSSHALPATMAAEIGIDEFSLLPGGGPLKLEGVAVNRHRDPVPSPVAAEPLAHGLDEFSEHPTRRAQRDDDRTYRDRIGALRPIRSDPVYRQVNRLDIELGKLGAQLAGQPLACLRIQLRIRREDQQHAHYVAGARIRVNAAHQSRP